MSDELFIPENELTDKLTEKEKDVLSKIAAWIVKKKLTAIAIMMLEPIKPLGFVGSQALLFFEPFIRILPGTMFTSCVRSGISKRDGIEYLISEIERFESENEQRSQNEKSR